MITLTLEQLHEKITVARCELGWVDSKKEDSICLADERWAIDYKGEAPPAPEQQEEFRRLYDAAMTALNNLDSKFHDLWDCR